MSIGDELNVDQYCYDGRQTDLSVKEVEEATCMLLTKRPPIVPETRGE